MRPIPCLFVTLCLFASAIAQEPPKFSPAQQEVLDARKARNDAGDKRDYATWSRYIADDCIYSTDDGEIDANVKAHTQERWKRPLAYDHGENPREYVIHVYGNTAVINLRVTVHEQFTDTDIISEQRYTETYIKQNGVWMLIARQWGNLPVNFHQPVAVDPDIYQDYVGQYEWRPLDDVETVSVKDGKLWSRFSKDKDDEEYLPLSSDTFFVRDDIGSTQFVRDSHGKVTGYLSSLGRAGNPRQEDQVRRHSRINLFYAAHQLFRLAGVQLPRYSSSLQVAATSRRVSTQTVETSHFNFPVADAVLLKKFCSKRFCSNHSF